MAGVVLVAGFAGVGGLVPGAQGVSGLGGARPMFPGPGGPCLLGADQLGLLGLGWPWPFAAGWGPLAGLGWGRQPGRLRPLEEGPLGEEGGLILGAPPQWRPPPTLGNMIAQLLC